MRLYYNKNEKILLRDNTRNSSVGEHWNTENCTMPASFVSTIIFNLS